MDEELQSCMAEELGVGKADLLVLDDDKVGESELGVDMARWSALQVVDMAHWSVLLGDDKLMGW